MAQKRTWGLILVTQGGISAGFVVGRIGVVVVNLLLLAMHTTKLLIVMCIELSLLVSATLLLLAIKLLLFTISAALLFVCTKIKEWGSDMHKDKGTGSYKWCCCQQTQGRVETQDGSAVETEAQE